MRIKLPIINEPDTGLCIVTDLTDNREMSKILISTSCRNNYISKDLYNRLEHEDPQLQTIVKLDTAYYLNDLTNAKIGIIKTLKLPSHTLTDVQVIVTSSFPAYLCDMVLGLPITSVYRIEVNNASSFVTVSDESL